MEQAVRAGQNRKRKRINRAKHLANVARGRAKRKNSAKNQKLPKRKDSANGKGPAKGKDGKNKQ